MTSLFLSGCFEDEFTEEDLLNEMRYADLNVIIMDGSGLGHDLSDFSVAIINEGERREEMTDENGIAYFENVRIGQVPVVVSKSGYYTIRGDYQFDDAELDRKQQSVNLAILPSEGEAMATVSGQATLDLDLTSPETDYVPSGTELFKMIPNINLPGNFMYDGFPYVATTEENGEFNIEVPGSANGLFYTIQYNSFVANQSLAINRLMDQPAFPETLPTIRDIQVEFGTDPAAGIPTVSNLYATVGASSDNPAILGDVFTAGGEVTGVQIIDGGSGYSANASNIVININGVAQNGSNASVTAETDANGSIVNINVNFGGSGYSNFSVNQANATGFSSELGAGINIRSGATLSRNINFGTGSYQKPQVQ